MCVLPNSTETLARQNCVSILNRRQAARSTALYTAASHRDFKCKSCDKAFKSFQALGGHRASHSKLRLTGDGGGSVAPAAQMISLHECRECRTQFATGQALGGHMRKHVDSKAKRKRAEDDDDKDHENSSIKKQIKTSPVLSKLSLDLNFPPPLEEYCFLQLV